MKKILLFCLLSSSVLQANEFGDWLNEKLAKINKTVNKVGTEELENYKKAHQDIVTEEGGQVKGGYRRLTGFEEQFFSATTGAMTPFSNTSAQKLSGLRNEIFITWSGKLVNERGILTDEALSFARNTLLHTQAMINIHHTNTIRAAKQVKILMGVFAGIVVVSGVLAGVVKAKKRNKAARVA